MKFRFKHLLFTFLVLIIAIGCSQKDEDKNVYKAPAKMVKTVPLKKFNGFIERHITGRLQAADTTSIAFEVSGVVKKVHIGLGESFKEGDLLAELDRQIYQLAVDQRASLLGEAKAAQVEARQSLDRNLSLKQQALVSQALVDNAQAAFDIANQRVNSAISALNIDKENLADTKLYAPYNGTISARLVEPSQQVNPQLPAFTIQGEANLEITAAISESIIGRIELGEKVKVLIPALGREKNYLATLTEIGSQASIGNAFPITITFLSAHKELLPGMSAEVLLPIKETPTQNLHVNEYNQSPLYDIPLSALATDANGQYIRLVVKDAEGYISQKHYFQIVQTLPSSLLARLDIAADSEHEVIIAGTEFLNDQQAINPLRQTLQLYNQ